MTVKIIKVYPDSPAKKIGIEEEDVLIKINSIKITDILDYQFACADEKLRITFKKNNNKNIVVKKINKEYSESLGLQIENFKIKGCRNNCIFCFCNQNHPDARDELKFKDEDYRMSFLWGNYITLTNTGIRDIQRINRLRLSPLYISVHSTNHKIREKLLGRKLDYDILDKLKLLASYRISMHTQIVIIPDINDGLILDSTVSDLMKLYPFVQSIAVVPVGITKYGKNNLKPVTRRKALEIIRQIEKKQKQILKINPVYLFLSDEFYLIAKKKLPEFNEYEDFPQIENGVGMIRYFENQFMKKMNSLRKKWIDKKLILVTGDYFYPFLNKYIQFFNKKFNTRIKVVKVVNSYYGTKIKTAGLLTGHDILKKINSIKTKKDTVFVIPDIVLNYSGKLFLDNMTLKEFKSKCTTGTVSMFPTSKLFNSWK